MRGTVTIAGKPVELKATASTIRKYRAWFDRDLLNDFKKIQADFTSGAEVTSEVIEMIENLTYVMAKQADPNIKEGIDDWLDQFESFPIEEFAVDVVTFWAKSIQPGIESKNV